MNDKTADTSPCQLRDFLGNRFVYAVISQRAGGLMIGVEMNPDQNCNYDCVYCYVQRSPENERRTLNLRVMSAELKELLQQHRLNRFQEMPAFRNIPEDLLNLKGIALSGEGEPTLCPRFAEVITELLSIRDSKQWADFKLVLITNGTGLELPSVQEGLSLFRTTDEVWIKLDAGTDEALQAINRGTVPVGKVVDNIVALGQWRPVIIQSLFCSIDGGEPEEEEIDRYIGRLLEIKERGANITEIQVYSIVRPPAKPGCVRLSLSQLSAIAKRIRAATELCVEVY